MDKLVESPDLVISIATKLKEEKAARIAAEEAKKMLVFKSLNRNPYGGNKITSDNELFY